jgi:prolyl oligopeptidase
MYKGTFVGDEYWAIADDSSGCCRLVVIPLDSAGDRSTWRELLPATEERMIASITQCGD